MRARFLLGLAAAASLAGAAMTLRAAAPVVNETVAIVDPYAPTQQAGVDGAGNLKVTCNVGCSGGSASNAADGVATSSSLGQTQSYLYLWNGAGFDRGVNGHGTAAKALRVELPTDGSGVVGLNAGSNTIGGVKLVDTSGGNVGAIDASGRLATNLGAVGGTAVATGNGATSTGTQRVTLSNDSTGVIGLSAGTTGGCTPYNLSGGSAASTNATSIKGSAGTLCHLTVISTSATLAYLRLYDSASAPTCSSATGAKHSYPVPASNTGAGVAIPLGPFGEAYANGIGFCLTGGGADTDNTSAPIGVFVNASFK
jgi:hypothetical protein